MSMEVFVIGLLVLPPILVGIVGWAAARLGARSDRRSEMLAGVRREGYARVAGTAEEPPVADRRAA